MAAPKIDVEVKWIHLAIAIALNSGGVVVWGYSTFVTIRERDMVKAIFEERLARIEQKQDQANDKLDSLISRLASAPAGKQ